MTTTAAPTTTDALVTTAYGPVQRVVRHDTVPVRALRRGEVLVRTAAVSLNAADLLIAHGEPRVARLAFGVGRPREAVRGRDLAGVVAVVGPDVTAWEVGDRVAAEIPGALARLVPARADRLARVPDDVSWTDAATVPLAGVTALQAVRKAGVRAGDRVLVTGAAGGVGSFVVQLLRAAGADVVGECRPETAATVVGLGAEPLDRGTPLGVGTYAAAIEVGGGRTLGELRRAVVPGGTVVLASGHAPGPFGVLGRLVGAPVLSLVVPQRLRPLAASSRPADVTELLGAVAAGTLRPLVGATVPFERGEEAFALLDTGGVRGKVVVTF
ncbi:NAD(P)-dependent alcohol dehydrogenase [Cellulomonas sp. S1-8]|uniref:NAD(P)-dependent alcohol dehydrogenase n=1 Tax=Cellulomonas sp. S1-8 TaxID=2904790 RepID=UPI002244AA07|nr:NAD(P)-dependent alcohol dehydrogenase [Cellulomonas sp. S1-8]UZN02793.1 NAD(P)-dependent alcohol dehydrogenase [Cellulomonas sp. S1-8]